MTKCEKFLPAGYVLEKVRMFLRYEIHAEVRRSELSYALENVRMHIIPGVSGRTRISALGRLKKFMPSGLRPSGMNFL